MNTRTPETGNDTDSLSLTTIYAAENMAWKAIRRGGDIVIDGHTFTLDGPGGRPVNLPTFHSGQAPLMQGVVDGLYRAIAGPNRPTAAPSLRLSRAATRRAWYNQQTHTIVLPRKTWALDVMVIAHEVAHAAVGAGHDQRAGHGLAWRRKYAQAVAVVAGPVAGALMLSTLDAAPTAA